MGRVCPADPLPVRNHRSVPTGVLLAPLAADSVSSRAVQITLLSDDSIRLDATPGPLTIEAPSEDRTYSPFHMLGSSIAICTFSVLYSWAEHAGLDADGLAIEVSWTFAEDPHRVGEIHTRLVWPGLPPQRVAAAQRVAALCPIHGTLTHPPALTTEVVAGAASAVPA